MSEKYSPHVIVAWGRDGKVAIQKYPTYEEALEKYLELENVHCPKIWLAKMVREHGEG